MAGSMWSWWIGMLLSGGVVSCVLGAAIFRWNGLLGVAAGTLGVVMLFAAAGRIGSRLQAIERLLQARRREREKDYPK
jgi:hypothetical protein